MNQQQGYEATGRNPNYQPHTASDFLEKASETLGERGKQYDPAGKQERSMTAIVAAFNAIYPRNPLTVHMGWQFMSLVKMVRGAAKPHADSALDQVAYAALAAEEVASQLHQPKHTELCEDEGCPHHGTPHVCITSVETKKQYMERTKEEHELAEELGKCQHWAGVQSQELKHLEAKAKAAQNAYKELQARVQWGQVQHEQQVAALQKQHITDVARFNKERKANTAMQDEVIRLRGKLQDTYNEVESLAQELEAVRGECISRGAQLAEARAKVEALSNRELGSLACLKAVIQTAAYLPSYVHEKIQTVVVNGGYGYLYQASEANWKREPEPVCAHNTDEPKASPSAPCTSYVDPYDSHGDVQPKPLPRTVGSADPARGGLAYPQGKPLEPL